MDDDAHLVDNSAYELAAYLRVASIAVALYDFLETLPTARRFYRHHWQSRRLTTSCALFFLLQFFSIIVITVSNVGFFYKGFSQSSCHRFYVLAPIFKVIQLMVSQAILAVRVFNLSRRSVRMGIVLTALFIAAITLEWSTNLYGRTSWYDPQRGNCRATALVGTVLATWLCYVVAIVFNLIVTSISVAYLLQHHLTASTSLMSRVTRIMIYDGVAYFVILTAINVVNLILYHSADDFRTAAASLGYCLTWIMSQRLLIHLHNASLERRNESINQAVTITRTIESHRQISEAMRSQFEPKSDYNFRLTVPDYLSTIETGPEASEDVGVEVRIERTYKVDRQRASYSLENYSRHARS